MSWEQIGVLATDKLCTIASHTVSHGVLPNMSEEQVETELQDSKIKLEHCIQKKVEHFAYPYGAWNDSVINQIMNIGYKTAVLGNGGKVRKGCNAKELKRNSLIQN